MMKRTLSHVTSFQKVGLLKTISVNNNKKQFFTVSLTQFKSTSKTRYGIVTRYATTELETTPSITSISVNGDSSPVLTTAKQLFDEIAQLSQRSDKLQGLIKENEVLFSSIRNGEISQLNNGLKQEIFNFQKKVYGYLVERCNSGSSVNIVNSLTITSILDDCRLLQKLIAEDIVVNTNGGNADQVL
ncbi:hypothetical protein ABK040_005629 [Willaertia magna]